MTAPRHTPPPDPWYARMARRECRGLPPSLWTDERLAGVPLVWLARLARAVQRGQWAAVERRAAWWAGRVGEGEARAVVARVEEIVGHAAVAAA